MIRPRRLLAPAACRLWLAGAFLYLLLRVVPVRGPLAWYGPDLLCLPLVLGLVLAAQRLAGRPPGWRLPVAHGVAVTLAFIVWFEWAAPRWLGRGTGDAGDAAAYVLGWAFFAWRMNRT